MRRSLAMSLTVGLTLAFAALAWPSIGWAALLTDSPNLPPLDGEYVNQGDWFAYYAPGVFITDVVQHGYTQSWPPPAPGMTDVHTFGETVDGRISFDGGVSFLPFSAPATETDRITNLGLVGNSATFDTEMLQLDMWGGSLPAYVMLRESPMLASDGGTMIINEGDGTYWIESFFDVFTELSLDGGMTWYPSQGNPTRMDLVPEPSGLTLLAAGLLALACLRRWMA